MYMETTQGQLNQEENLDQNLPSTKPIRNQKGNFLFIIGVIVLVFIIAWGAYYLGTRKNQSSSQPSSQQTTSTGSNQVPTIPTDLGSTNNATSKWPQVNLANTVLFTSQKYILGKATSNGQNVQLFNQELTQKYNSVQTWVSPDHNKLLFVLYGNPPKDSDRFNYQLATLDGKVIEKIDLDKIKGSLGAQYEVTLPLWSTDSKKLVFIARDVKNFLDNKSGEGGDYRSSKQIIGEYDIDNSEIKELFTKTQAPLGVLFYDPAKELIVYSDSQLGGGKAHLLNIQNNQETEFNSPTELNLGGNQYFVDADNRVNGAYQEARNLKIYSFYEPTKAIAEITIDEPTNRYFTNWVIWSPNSKYFAIKIVNSDNTFSDLLKIYDKNGKLVLRTNLDMFDGSVFSSDDKYLLSSKTSGASGTYLTTWETIDVTTGTHLINPFKSTDVGHAFFWFK